MRERYNNDMNNMNYVIEINNGINNGINSGVEALEINFVDSNVDPTEEDIRNDLYQSDTPGSSNLSVGIKNVKIKTFTFSDDESKTKLSIVQNVLLFAQLMEKLISVKYKLSKDKIIGSVASSEVEEMAIEIRARNNINDSETEFEFDIDNPLNASEISKSERVNKYKNIFLRSRKNRILT